MLPVAKHRIASHPQVVFAVCVSSGRVHVPKNLDIEPSHSVQLPLDDCYYYYYNYNYYNYNYYFYYYSICYL